MATTTLRTAAEDSTATAVDRLLQVARQQLALDVVFLSHFSPLRRELLAVSGAHPFVEVGRSDPLDDTFCQQLVEGRLPAVIPDARTDPDTAGLPATTELDIGLHVGVPVALSDGSLFGTVCGFRHEADPDADWRTARVLRVIAQALAELLEPAERDRRTDAARRAAVLGLLDAGQPRVVTQPIRRLDDGVTVAVEALSRFDRTETPVAEVFADAASAGVGVELELAALRAALAVVPTSAVPVTVNGGVDLLLDPRAHELLAACAAQQVVLEVTERQAVTDYDALNAALSPLRDAGLRLAVDDVGVGFSGLHHLLELRPDFIKLDACLVQGVDGNPRQQALVAALVAFAAQTGATLVAEGIETPADRDRVARLGVALGQGFLLGRPA